VTKRAVARLPKAFKGGTCINCDEQAARRPGSLFCGERCRQVGELIRYTRRKIADGTIDRPDIAEAIESRKSQLVVGFYDKRSRAVAGEIREELLTRARGKCEKCGAPFTPDGVRRFTVQHTPMPGAMKLEAWCWQCNTDDSLSYSFIMSDEQIAFVDQFEARVRAEKPLFICDDPVAWPLIFRDLQQAARGATNSVAGNSAGL
jgi:hypothetical protein